MGITSLSTFTNQSSSTSIIMSSMEYAKELLESVKENFYVPEAVDDIAECCAIFAKEFGETDVKCAEPYFYYGKALLEVSRLEAEVLGHAMEGIDIYAEDSAHPQVESPDVLPNTEKATIEKDVSEAMTSNFRAHSMVAKYHEGDVDSDDEGPEDDGSDDDIGHLEHAWEMLEMARMIWSKAGKVDLACEALHFLGEVSMEGHNYEQAIADFEDCLSKRIAALPSGSRSIAETHYWHGVALAHMNMWSEAETALNKALDQIDARIHTIEMMEPSEHMTHEKDDLEELMIAVVARIEDQKDMQKGTYVEEEVDSGKIPYMQAVEGALQHAKKSGAQSASTA